jgi:enoyl-CoA hydratase/carnithine racemase
VNDIRVWSEGAVIRGLADAFEHVDADPGKRAIVLCSEGKNFCAGANFASAIEGSGQDIDPLPLYAEAVRLFRTSTPIVAAIQGAAVGGGLGLAMVADFRVIGPSSRMVANFNQLGIHPGFGLSVTLPRVIGVQQAALLFYTGKTLAGLDAVSSGLADILAEDVNIRAAALDLATAIAASAPLAVTATRRTLRGRLADEIADAVQLEASEQRNHFRSDDFREGVRAMAERRTPQFSGA